MARNMANAYFRFQTQRGGDTHYCFTILTPVSKIVRPSFNQEQQRGLAFTVSPDYKQRADGTYGINMRVQFTPIAADPMLVGNGLLVVSASIGAAQSSSTQRMNAVPPSQSPAKPSADAGGKSSGTPPIEVCYNVFPDGRCLMRTGEYITSMSDLENVPDWSNVTAETCAKNGNPVEVHLRAPTRNDGRKRYIECIGAVYLKERLRDETN
jgi:hypothetical protein